MVAPNFTADRLRELLNYDPETGIFRWKVARRRIKAGAIAGNLQTHGYVMMRVDGFRCGAHRLAWLYMHGCWPTSYIDHINGIPSDNRIANLREATPSQNQINRKIPDGSKTRVKGVHWCPERNQWRAHIYVGNKRTYLGRYTNFDEAVEVRMLAEELLHGEYRRFNL